MSDATGRHVEGPDDRGRWFVYEARPNTGSPATDATVAGVVGIVFSVADAGLLAHGRGLVAACEVAQKMLSQLLAGDRPAEGDRELVRRVINNARVALARVRGEGGEG